MKLSPSSSATWLLVGLILLVTLCSVTEVEGVKVGSWSKVRSRTTASTRHIKSNKSPPPPPPVWHPPPPPKAPPPPPPPPAAVWHPPPPPPPAPVWHPPPAPVWHPPPAPTWHPPVRHNPPAPAPHYHSPAPAPHRHHSPSAAANHHHTPAPSSHHHHHSGGGNHHHHHQAAAAHHHGHSNHHNHNRHNSPSPSHSHHHHHHHHNRHNHHSPSHSHHNHHSHHRHGHHGHGHHHHVHHWGGHGHGHRHGHHGHGHGHHAGHHRHGHHGHGHGHRHGHHGGGGHDRKRHDVPTHKQKLEEKKKEEKKKDKKKRDPSEFAGFVGGLYQQYLCRSGEAGGMAFWTGGLAAGTMTESDVVAGFIGSAEYQARGGKPCGFKKKKPSDFDGFVNGLYNQYLCRDGEPGGMAGWTGHLAAGTMTEGQVVSAFLNSAEYRGRGGRPCGGGAPAPAPIIAAGGAPLPPPPAVVGGGGTWNRWAPQHGGRVAALGRGPAPPGAVWQPPVAGPGAPAWFPGASPAAAAVPGAAPAPFVPAPPAPVAAPVIVKEWVPDPAPNAPWRAPPAVQINYPDILWDRSASTAQLQCPQGQRIRVLDASYGAGQGIWTASGFIHKGVCHADSSFAKAYRICSRQRSCSVAASTGIFGEPCQGTDKELLVTYQCTPAPKKGVVEAPLPDPISPTPVQILYDGIFMTQKRSGKTASLTCPAGQVINLLDATYGSHPGLYASNGYITRGACHASSSLSVVSTACHGNAECRVRANDAIFPDSGCTEERKLKVTWRCADKAGPFVPRLGPKPRRYRHVKKASARVSHKARAEEVVNIAPPVGEANQVHVHVNVAAPKSKSSNTGLQAMVDRVAAKNQAAAEKMDEILAKLKSQNCKGPDCLPDTKELEEWKADWVLEAQEIAEIVP